MADSDPQRPLEQRSTASRSIVLYTGIRQIISSPRFRRAAVGVWCVLKVIIFAGVVYIFLKICRLVVHNQAILMANQQAMLVSVQGTVQDLSNKLDALSAFIKTQQQALLGLLSKFESEQDKNAQMQELVQSVKAVQEMSQSLAQSQRQAVVNGGAIEKKVGKAVIGLGQTLAPWPLKVIMSGYDLLTGLKTLVKK
jgi:hypothetical protein